MFVLIGYFCGRLSLLIVSFYFVVFVMALSVCCGSAGVCWWRFCFGIIVGFVWNRFGMLVIDWRILGCLFISCEGLF